MADKKVLYNEFVSMFDIAGELQKKSKEGSDIGEDSFEDLSKLVSDEILEDFDQIEVTPEVTPEVKEETLEEFDKIDVPEVKEVAGKKEDEDIIKSISDSKKEDKDKVDFDSVPEVKEKSNNTTETEVKNDRELNIENGVVQWLLKSPSRLYDVFYSDKKEVIDSITDGFHIPFNIWTNELIESKIKINTEVFDNKTYIKQMYLIQNHLDRVKEIQIKVNNQYFLCDEFFHRLEGCLARVEYLKPALKQDGLVFEHMKDLIWYLSKLKHLHESSKSVVKTLEKAWETVSRKASLTTPTKSIEKYTIGMEEPKQKVYKEVKENFNEYDDLPSEASVVFEKKKTDFCEWGEIGKK